jgi:antitoxin component YwqK of YwqJK toxin-antitoxin module
MQIKNYFLIAICISLGSCGFLSEQRRYSEKRTLLNDTIRVDMYFDKKLILTSYVLDNEILFTKKYEYYKSGKLKSEVPLIKGKKEGVKIIYYESGKIKGRIDYRNDVENGKYITYYENGNIKSECDYFERIPDGFEVKYYNDGSLFAKLIRHRLEYTEVVEVFDRNGIRLDWKQYRKIRDWNKE